MKLLLSLSVFLTLGSLHVVQSAPRKAPKKAQAKKAKPASKGTPQEQYAARVMVLWTETHRLFGPVYDAQSNNSLSYAQKVRPIAQMRASLSKMRAISPVPKSFAKADKLLVEWTMEIDKFLDGMKDSIDNPGGNGSQSAISHYENSQAIRELFFDELQRSSDPGINAKKYVDG